MAIDFSRMRERLQQFDFQRLFVDDLGWSKPSTRDATEMTIKGASFKRRQISQLAGVAVFEVSAEDGRIPDAKTRAAIDKEIFSLFHEHLLIFVDKERTQSLWYWVKRRDGKPIPRDHFYLKGQPGDLFLSKLGGIVFEITDFDQAGNVPVFEVAQRLRSALDVERVTKRFYNEFYQEHLAFIEYIKGISDERERRWYASVLLNRLMFVYFLQRKGFIDNGNLDYLQRKLSQSRDKGNDLFYGGFLKLLFFEGFAKPEEERSPEARRLLGSIKYLNGGLFLPHRVEQNYPSIHVPDKAFENIFSLFQRYSWNLNDTPGGQDNEISPDVLGYIFEKYINQKAFGAYYTRPEITEYLCGQTIHKLILNAINTPEVAKQNPIRGLKTREYQTIADLLMNLDGALCRELLFQVLPNLALLDPACGSGAFLVAAMKVLINVYAAAIGRIKFLGHKDLHVWLDKTEREHKSLSYYIKKRIITDNLYGVDIMEEATEIARLRLFLALVASSSDVNQLEPLPNIDFNILPGNSLVGLMRVNDQDFEKRNAQTNLFRQSYRELLTEKNRLIDTYRHTATFTDDLTGLRDQIDKKKAETLSTLDDILLDQFKQLGIKHEESTWNAVQNREGRSVKRQLRSSDVEALHPFHWGYEFDRILNERGGFDAIITNPPWETFRPDAKEFFAEYSDAVTKKSMSIKDFEKELKRLLTNGKTLRAWLEYLSRFNHLRHFFRLAEQYKNQVPIIDGKRQGSDVNLFKLFLEQCFNLLRQGGECGIVIPSGIYTDLGATQLRELLFTESQVTGLFCFENRKEIFEGVHRSFKFVVLTFQKGGTTTSFPAAFMRHDASELERFPQQDGIDISVELIRRLSPDSLSLVEFKTPLDVRIAEKMVRFPLVGEAVKGAWQIELHREFHMTDDARLFQESPKAGMLPLFEGKMMWQYDDRFSEPRYWIDEQEGRSALMAARLRRVKKVLEENNGSMKVDSTDIELDYEHYRLGYRDVASSTNERAMICTILPRRVFAGNTVNLQRAVGDRIEGGRWRQTSPLSSEEMLFVAALFNSFTLDWMMRSKITSHLNMFYVYQLPVPRLTVADRRFVSIVGRAGRLICTRPEFDDLAREIGLSSHKAGVTTVSERARVKAEIDGLVAHLYGLNEEEFAHILSTFVLVPDPVKIAAQNAYRDVGTGLLK